MKLLILGKLSSKQVFFEKHFISYSFILFIKYYALRSFCKKFALFFKKLVFPKFRLIKPFSWPIEIAIKILVWLCLFRLMLDCYWINWRYFQSIESNFRSIEISIESFLKPLFLTCSSLFKPFSKHFLSLFDWSKGQSKIFFIFKFLQGFLSSKAGKTFVPLIFHLFSCFMHFFTHFRENVEPKGNWDFWWFNLFLWKLITRFLLWGNIKLFFGGHAWWASCFASESGAFEMVASTISFWW